jgi:multidrug efflux pump subunit AcrA (membrane-fusion protein)
MMRESGFRWLAAAGLIGLVLITLAACGGPEAAAPSGSETPVGAGATPMPTMPPPETRGQAVTADGRLVSPYPSLPLSFGGGVSGEVVTITVRPGDAVEAGALLAQLDDTELQRAVDDAELALERATIDRERAVAQWERDVADAEEALAAAERARTTARLEYSDTSVEEARTSLERAQQAEADAEQEYLKAIDFWPPLPVDEYYDAWQRAIRERELAEMRLADAEDAQGASYLELESRDTDVVQAERALAALQEGVDPAYDRAVEDAELQLADAEEALDHARLTAPWDAIVLSVDVAPAATASAGTPVVTLLNVSQGLRFVTEDLSEQHVAEIRPGQRAVVTLRTFPEQPVDGAVEAVVPLVEETADAEGRFAVHIRLDATELCLLPGLTGRVEIFTEE